MEKLQNDDNLDDELEVLRDYGFNIDDLLSTLNDTLFNTFSPSTVFEIFSTESISFPDSLSGLKSINGYLLVEGLISSN